MKQNRLDLDMQKMQTHQNKKLFSNTCHTGFLCSSSVPCYWFLQSTSRI